MSTAEIEDAVDEAFSIHDYTSWAKREPLEFSDQPVPIRVYSLDQVDDFIAEFETAAGRVGFDFETNTLNTTWEGIQLGGLGLATREVGAYLWWQCFESRSYEMPTAVKTKIRKLLWRLDQKRQLVVFNLKYELAVTANQKVFGVYLPGLVDAMQYCRTLDITGGLKEILVNRMKLGDKWTDDIDVWLRCNRIVLSSLKPLKNPRPEFTALKEGGIGALFDYYNTMREAHEAANVKIRADNEAGQIDADRDNMEFTPKPEKEGNGLNKREQVIEAAVEELLAKSPDFEYDLGQALADYWIEKVERHDFEALYTELPLQYCSKYCALDSYNTVLLMDNVCVELEQKGLMKAADYYNQQIYLGAAMEANAIFWDDSKADEIKDRYQTVLRDALKRFLLTTRAKKVLELTAKDVIDIQSSTDLVQLKAFFNPDSTNAKATVVLGQILVTAKTKLCLILQEVNHEYLIDPDTAKRTMPALCAVMNKLLAYKGPERAGQLTKVHAQLEMLLAEKKLRSGELEICIKHSNYQMTSATAEVIQGVGTAIRTFQGCDIDDDRTWTEEMQAIFYYKLYKKVSKVLSSFLDGAGGRKNCMLAKYSDNGQVVRVTPYLDADDTARKGSLVIYEPNFNVNGAKTKRWTAAVHGVPSMAESRSCYTSRFSDGIIIHKDYSQQELRCLAAISGDEAMLAAFVANRDLHKMVASTMYACTEDEVTANQRSIAKSANFGIIYLKTVETFAQDFMNGDIPATQRLFDSIFKLFPRMKEWMKEQIDRLKKCMKEAKARGDWQCTVPIMTLWGDPILHTFKIDKKMDVIDAERYVINWVIQSTASNIGALSIARVEEWLKADKMKSVINCFTHDSLDADTKGSEFMTLMEEVPKIAESRPLQEFNLPVRLDAEIGADYGSLVEVKRNKETDAFVTNGRMDSKIEGTVDNVAKLLAKLRMTHPDLEYETLDEKPKKNSWSDVFSLKGCYYPDMGREVIMETGRLVIVEESRHKDSSAGSKGSRRVAATA